MLGCGKPENRGANFRRMGRSMAEGASKQLRWLPKIKSYYTTELADCILRLVRSGFFYCRRGGSGRFGWREGSRELGG